ncbi:MAG TPA: efflux RND transporter periplasmic adaptor subunit [Thermodesulfovibrionales bacterium]|nr:efflux RND transporter periplasmic adaptor subunit [Thermodesulfovibrionales bacterium]
MKKRVFSFKANVVLLSITGVVAVAIAGGCGQKAPPPKKQAVPVKAATVAQKTVPVQIKAIGNVEAYSTVGVKSQIGGELSRVHFREGQDVSKGDLLFTIDPRPYEAALRQAEANLAKNTAQLENAREEVRRNTELVKKGYVAHEQYDKVRTNFAALEAAVNSDKAVVENAQLQLKYCFINSPITGRTGNLQSNQGNLIKANADSAMVTINQVQPIYVTFSVPEQYLAEIKKYMSMGKLKVQAVIGQDQSHPEEGVLTFVDNAVDTTTGTIKLKATFANNGRKLWPGQFVNAIMTLTSQQNAIVIPSEAIQTGQTGQYVFVIKDDLTVESRPVVSSRSFDSETVLEKGLRAGEKVVTDGQLRLVPGVTVEIKPAEAAAQKPAPEAQPDSQGQSRSPAPGGSAQGKGK